MAKKTFLNLNAEKREQFLKVAFREFAEHDYHSASISRIVAKLGIAKGSLYQYFEDKQDLYIYLLDVASKRKNEFIRESTSALAESGSFYELLKAIVLAGAAFDIRNPHYRLLILNAMKEHQSPKLENLAKELRLRSTEFLRDFVRMGIDRGTIRAGIDISLIVELTDALSLAIVPYMAASRCTL